ncbi:MAG TPA: hypothetical protein VK028_05125, partial [Micromonosporaceae bacterium]|nr:hypothetical protein [Micromonosporaceae bacterium]
RLRTAESDHHLVTAGSGLPSPDPVTARSKIAVIMKGKRFPGRDHDLQFMIAAKIRNRGGRFMIAAKYS